MTKPKPISATLDRCQARRVRSAANSTRGSGGSGMASEFVGGVAAVSGAHKRKNFPKIVGILNDGAELHHRANDVFSPCTGVTLFLKFVATEGDQSKQRVVIASVNPNIVGERRPHSAAGAAAVATAAGIPLK